jgi:NitT/TauT family transport system permease protein
MLPLLSSGRSRSGRSPGSLAGGVLALLFNQSKWLEYSLFPYAVVLQVTPIVAVAPLILIYVESTTAALLLCAWIVAFFPILSNTVIGLRAADANLRDLFRLYRATPWQRLRLLRLPAALPYFVAGLKISGGLSLIGAVTAEMVAGAAGRETGLASRILEASFRTETPKMFAALTLLVLTGVLLSIFVAPLWIALAGFVGAGLSFAGMTGWCGMAQLLGMMPWNRQPA